MVVVGREGENVNRALVLVNAVPVVKFVEVKNKVCMAMFTMVNYLGATVVDRLT